MVVSSEVNGGGRWTEAIVVTSLVAAQMVFGFNTVFLSGLLAGGLQPLFQVAAAGFFNAFLLIPFAILFERKNWPHKIGLHLAIRFVLIAVGGTPLYQVFMLMGVKKTTPAVATAMPNLAPGLIFIIASCLRIEKFDIKCKYTRYKVMGTVICLSGAMAMSFLQGNSATNLRSIFLREDLAINTSSNEWIIGCLYLLASVVILSCVLVLQATTMVDFPAPISLGVITSTIGSFFAVIFQYMLQGNINSGAASLGLTGVISAVLVGGSVSFISSTVVTMCVHKKGPVFVSVFHPTQTVCAAIFSALILKQFISLGSMIGMGLMISGLYVVLWAKIREADKEESRLIPDEEKALLF